MQMRDQLLTVANAYGEARKLSSSRVSFLVFHDGKKLDRVVNGSDLYTSRFEHAMAWFSTNWPPNAEWPHGIPRPTPTPAEPVRASA